MELNDAPTRRSNLGHQSCVIAAHVGAKQAMQPFALEKRKSSGAGIAQRHERSLGIYSGYGVSLQSRAS